MKNHVDKATLEACRGYLDEAKTVTPNTDDRNMAALLLAVNDLMVEREKRTRLELELKAVEGGPHE